jgi:transglutaminase-like putative cysteine protease
MIKAQAPPAKTLPLPLPRQGFEQYLRATTLAPIDDPRLHDLAREIVGERTDAYQAALAISHWVYQRLHKLDSQPSPINALQILDQMRGDCSEHSLLTAALARAVGVPSRMVTGLAAIRDHVYYHAWVEVYVGEWVELDPSWNEDLVDAGHLRIADSDLDPVTFTRMNLETGRTFGSLSLKVLDYQTQGE